MSLSRDVLRDDPDSIVDDLKKAAIDLKPVLQTRMPDKKCPATKECHERSVIGQNADLPIEGGRDDRVRLAVKHRSIGRDDRNVHHALASFLAFSTASSMLPTM
jgi:hypothetical protein